MPPPAADGPSAPESADWPPWCRRCPSTPQGLGEVAGRLQDTLAAPADTAGPPVLLSCLEFIEPHPEDAVRQLSEQGIGNVVVMPYLLGHGKHATIEMDELLDEVRAHLPQVRLHLADGLGADARLADLVVDRIGDLGPGGPGSRPGRDVGILLVKAGTRTQYDDCQWLAEWGGWWKSPRFGLCCGCGPIPLWRSHYGVRRRPAGVGARRGGLNLRPYIFFPGLILTRNVLGAMDQLQAPISASSDVRCAALGRR